MGEEQPRLDLVRQAEQVGVAPGGGVSRYRPGKFRAPYHPTPEPSPLVGTRAHCADKLWSTRELVGS